MISNIKFYITKHLHRVLCHRYCCIFRRPLNIDLFWISEYHPNCEYPVCTFPSWYTFPLLHITSGVKLQIILDWAYGNCLQKIHKNSIFGRKKKEKYLYVFVLFFHNRPRPLFSVRVCSTFYIIALGLVLSQFWRGCFFLVAPEHKLAYCLTFRLGTIDFADSSSQNRQILSKLWFFDASIWFRLSFGNIEVLYLICQHASK